MRFYNAKTRSFYDTERILIVGDPDEARRRVAGYGFFPQLVHFLDEGTIPENLPFLVSETTPPDWRSETIPLDDFEKAMDKKQVADLESASEVLRGEPEKVPETQCLWAEPGGLITPCRGREIVCRHPEAGGTVRMEITCRPPDPSKDFEYNLRSCALYAD